MNQKTATENEVRQEARKISVLGARPESVPGLDEGSAPILEEDEILVFADGQWKSGKTGKQWDRKVFKSLWGGLISLTHDDGGTGRVERLGREEYGVSGTGKFIRLSDGGMTIETSDTPFEEQ
ncbi:MAG: hypothetical protein FWH27_13245 [Planctomycetaceae bacterium]|nr:hypothetical protein [Planctomycetaceae bacterium]